MRYLAIDYGSKRLGLAHCDSNETIISPLCQLANDATNPNNTIKKLEEIIIDQQIEAVVIGLPFNMDGTEGDQARMTRVFIDKLAQAVSLPVHIQDERLSSAAADEMLADRDLTRKQRKARRDMLAACDILRGFLGQ